LAEVSGKQPAGGSQIQAANEGDGNSSVGSSEERLHTASDSSGAVDCNGMNECLKGSHLECMITVQAAFVLRLMSSGYTR
jgi:hypothetical protein